MENGEFANVAPTTEKSKVIQPIGRDTVHQICSGQVVLNLATAVKELVENAVDAGANIVEIRLKEYGKDLVEVSDNGSGVQEENFQALTLKHHTSKLRDFSDLIGVETFGFRGEALSSLCALSEMTITTRHKSADIGAKLEFDTNGVIVKRTACARQIGTTVTMKNLFSTLPVRQKEFHKHLKREFDKMAQLLYAYCLVALHVKLTCTNQKSNGTRSPVVSTQGNKSLRDNIACLFGPKQVQTLLDINFNGEIDEEMFIADESEENSKARSSELEEIRNSSKIVPFTFEGVISSCAHGSGRSANDRQFYFINSRPCEPTKIMKTVNEVYRQYNVHQSPFICLKITAESHDVDVNVTPDKRQIFINSEKLMLIVLRHSLKKLFETIPSTFKLQNTHFETMKLKQTTFDAVKTITDSKSQKSLPPKNENKTLKRKLGFLERFVSSSKLIRLDNEENDSSNRKDITDDDVAEIEPPVLSDDSDVEFNDCSSRNIYKSPKEYIIEIVESKNTDITSELKYSENNSDEELEEEETNSCSVEILEPKTVVRDSDVYSSSDKDISFDAEADTLFDDVDLDEIETKTKNNIRAISVQETEMNNSATYSKQISRNKRKKSEDKPTVMIKTSMEQIKASLKLQLEKQQGIINNSKSRVKFHSEIAPGKNELAEQELDREITKDKFSEMEIIGQFNLGFIISKLENDLFIVDQHASDEKYNFETLQKSTVLQSQKLLIPKTLELSTVNESMLIDNLEIFKKNGFSFDINEEAEPTKRIKLTSIPISKNWEFGKEDIDELLFMLEDSPNTMCRPSRVRTMLASRACRKSVMVGTPMTKPNMKKLLDNMGTIEQPWNCPHGRPTMRHLVNLELLDLGLDE